MPDTALTPRQLMQQFYLKSGHRDLARGSRTGTSGAGVRPLVREKDASTLGLCMQKTEFRSFAQGLFSDLWAIRAAIELPWSNGPNARHINRLKTLTRQMYGRAGFEVLRARVLAA